MGAATRFVAAVIVGAGATVPAPSLISVDPISPSAAEGARAPLAGSVASAAAPDVAAPADTPAPLRPAPLALLVNIHTGETAELREDEPSPDRLAALLEDRVTGERRTFDPRLLGLFRALAKKRPGTRIELVSGYRSAKLNELLRKKEHRVASHSQHSLGHAIDFRFGELSPKELRKELEALSWPGGIGQYDKPSDRFVHADVGPSRRWHER